MHELQRAIVARHHRLALRVRLLALALTSMVICLSFNAFFPTLTATLGYSRTVTLLLCAPPWGFATLVAFAVTRCVVLSSSVDRTRC